MKNTLFIILLVVFCFPAKVNAQNDSEFSLSSSVIRGDMRAEGGYHTGKAKGSGVMISYKTFLFKKTSFLNNVFFMGGIGYYNQFFNIPYGAGGNSTLSIPEPYDFSPRTSFNFDNFHWMGGLGYRMKIASHYSMNYALSYNSLETFHQIYSDGYAESRKTHLGSFAIFSAGVSRTIGSRLKISVDALVPAWSRWKNVPYYGPYEAIKGRSVSSFGGSLSVAWRF